MKMSKEYVLLLIVGLFLFGYVLDFMVRPLRLALGNPYIFFTPEFFSEYPFSMTSIFIKAVAIFITPLWLMSFWTDKGYAKPIMLLIASSLFQLYAIQDIVSNTKLIPLEWSLALTLAGAVLLIPTALLFIRAAIFSAHSNLTSARMKETLRQAQEEARKKEKEE